MKQLLLIIAAISLISCTDGGSLERNTKELTDADKAFSELSLNEGMKVAFDTYCASEGVLLRPQSMPVEGIQAVSEVLKGTDDSGFTLTWEPLHARVAKSGDLGYTYGVYTLQPSGSDEVQQGTYVSVWIKENGEWRFILDSGNEGVGN